jgi:hypothetical protein
MFCNARLLDHRLRRVSRRKSWLAGCGMLCLALASCGGGGGGGGSSFIPQPPVQPPPQQDQSVTIFPNPAVGEFASVGATVDGSAANGPLGAISTNDADQPHIRFMSDGTYQVLLPGKEWSELLSFAPGTLLKDADSNFEAVISGSKNLGYQYSELASYHSSDPQQFGAFAFGTLTPDGAVPVVGSATYTGTIAGMSDVNGSNAGQSFRELATGSVTLNFNFAAGALGGTISLGLIDEVSDTPLQIGTFAFTDTVFGVGSTSYAGKFDTDAVGDNFFLGKFTGPHAEETIGSWALPFTLEVGRANASNSTITADHNAHQAFGAWIAKSH